MSATEKERLAAALRHDLVALHHDRFESSMSEALTVYLLAVALRTGGNTTPLLEMTVDSIEHKTKKGAVEYLCPPLTHQVLATLQRYAAPLQAQLEAEIQSLQNAKPTPEVLSRLAQARADRKRLFLGVSQRNHNRVRVLTTATCGAAMADLAKAAGTAWKLSPHQTRRTYARLFVESRMGESLLSSAAEQIHIRATGHGWCLAQDEGCGGAGLYEANRCVDCKNAVIDDSFADIWLGIHEQQRELLSLDDVGPAVQQRARRDAERSATVLSDLGIEVPQATP